MRPRGWLAIAPVAVLAVAFMAASCSKKVVQTQAVSTPEPKVRTAEARKAEGPKADIPKAEVPKAPDRPAETPAQPARRDDDRLRAEEAAREAAKWVFLNEHVHFGFASSLLSDEARQVLRGKADYLRAHPAVMVTVEGHCDDRGTNAYNLALGERRAESVRTYLLGLGVGTARLNTVSYGKERPVAAGRDEASWARNRRAQFVIN